MFKTKGPNANKYRIVFLATQIVYFFNVSSPIGHILFVGKFFRKIAFVFFSTVGDNSAHIMSEKKHTRSLS